MPDIVDLAEIQVWDGAGGTTILKKGDFVDLLPTSPEHPDGERGKYLSHRHHAFMMRFLEIAGPYPVTSIYRWPCGRVEIGLKIPGRGPSSKAYDFMFVRKGES